MSRERKWAAGVYDPSFGFIVAGGWNDVTAEKTLDGETFTPIGNSFDMTLALRNTLQGDQSGCSLTYGTT